jgi:hypothetical protein
MGWRHPEGEKSPRPSRKAAIDPKKFLLRRPKVEQTLWIGPIDISMRCGGSQSAGETRNHGCECVGYSDISGPSANPWEFITRTVPKEARRAVNRWKGLEPRRKLGGDREAQAPGGTRPTRNPLSRGVSDSGEQAKDLLAEEGETCSGPTADGMPREIGDLLIGEPKKQKPLEECRKGQD